MSKLNDIWENRKLILEGVGNFVAKNKVVEEIAKERAAVCKSCPSLNVGCKSVSDCCGICGCNIGLKTRSLKASCPQQKWKAVNISK
jgi:hypothetical protein